MRPSKTVTKETVLDFYLEHKAKHPNCPSFCGFFWHKSRLRRVGTDLIYGEMQTEFQKLCTNNKVSWEECKNLMFHYKHVLDQKYCNMMYHHRFTDCDNCRYWDGIWNEKIRKCTMTGDKANYSVSDHEMQNLADSMEDMNVSD